MSSLEKFRSEVEGCLGDSVQNIGKWGAVLLKAKKSLNADDYESLEKFIRDRGFTQADITAAKAVAGGTLDSSLFFSGVASSKILSLTTPDQKRLLSGEKFDLLQPDKKTTKAKAWAEMTPAEKDQLLGPKGGGIKHADKQQVGATKGNRKSIVKYHHVEYAHKVLTLKNGQKTIEVDAGTIVMALMERGELDNFISDLEEIQKQQATAARLVRRP